MGVCLRWLQQEVMTMKFLHENLAVYAQNILQLYSFILFYFFTRTGDRTKALLAFHLFYITLPLSYSAPPPL
jgi:hypothetical protein